MIKTIINLRQRYKTWTDKSYYRYEVLYDFKPHFKWNIFDTDNEFVYDNEKWRDFIFGWIGVGYAWEAWSYWMTGRPYGYKLPDAFWAELNDWWIWERQK